MAESRLTSRNPSPDRHPSCLTSFAAAWGCARSRCCVQCPNPSPNTLIARPRPAWPCISWALHLEERWLRNGGGHGRLCLTTRVEAHERWRVRTGGV